jgi:hypothetical protein
MSVPVKVLVEQEYKEMISKYLKEIILHIFYPKIKILKYNLIYPHKNHSKKIKIISFPLNLLQK